MIFTLQNIYYKENLQFHHLTVKKFLIASNDKIEVGIIFRVMSIVQNFMKVRIPWRTFVGRWSGAFFVIRDVFANKMAVRWQNDKGQPSSEISNQYNFYSGTLHTTRDEVGKLLREKIGPVVNWLLSDYICNTKWNINRSHLKSCFHVSFVVS